MATNLRQNHAELVSFVIQHAGCLPAERRARVYRGLAEVCGEMEARTALHNLADAVEQTAVVCREFEFEPVSSPSPSPSPSPLPDELD